MIKEIRERLTKRAFANGIRKMNVLGKERLEATDYSSFAKANKAWHKTREEMTLFRLTRAYSEGRNIHF